jgi:predicted  nucleic acid-binding Zn-ribbon protein
MNQARRNVINNQISTLQDVESQLTDVLEGEQDAYDNMPESLQGGERGEAMQEAINQLEEAMEAIRNACDALSEALSQGRN